MTLDELCSAVFQDLNLNTVPSAATLARVRRYVNEGVRAVLREPGLERLVDSDAPFAFITSAGAARYAVSSAAARIQRIYETTNDRTLEAMPKDRYRRIAPDAAAHSGTPTHYVPIGQVAVGIQLLAPGPVYIESSQSENTTQLVHFEMQTHAGELVRVSPQLNGTTRVFAGGNVRSIEDCYLSALASGLVSVFDAEVGGNELARIIPGYLRPHYLGFYLWPTPTGAVWYSVDYRRAIADMVYDTDEPPLPGDFHPMIAAYARMREYEKADDDRYGIARAEYERALGRLKFETQWASDELPVLGRAGRSGHSRLGGAYPADSWR